MESPLINILIRTTKGREEEFKKCIDSIKNQTYKNIRVIVCTDDRDRVQSIGNLLGRSFRKYTYFYVPPTNIPYHWNFYCNNLKEHVDEGWFFYLDDDDMLLNDTVLRTISSWLHDPNTGIICQFMRGSKPKPSLSAPNAMGRLIDPKVDIVRGKIGGSCIFLHHSKKDLAHWDGKRAADYRFIKAIAERLPLYFVPRVVVQAGNNGRHGK